MTLDKEFAVKNRFWLLLALCAPLLLVVMIILLFVVPAQTANEKKKIDGERAKINKAANLKNEKIVEAARAKAKVLRDAEVKVWESAAVSQKDISSWPAEFEKEYPFRDGNFALEIVLHPDATKLAEMPPDRLPSKKAKEKDKDKEEEQALQLFHGVYDFSDNDRLVLKGRGQSKLTFYRTDKIKIYSTDDKDKKIEFAKLNEFSKKKFAVTFQVGKYFGDPLTDLEQVAWSKAYHSQILDVLREAGPLNERNEPVVQFRLPGGAGRPGGGDAWEWKKDNKDLPPQEAKFCRYVKDINYQNINVTDDAWIAQEEIWVQRELMRLVKKANDYVAQFEGKGGAGIDKTFTFTNPYWQLDLTLKNAKQVHVKVKNRTESKQPLVYFAVQVQKGGKYVVLPLIKNEPLAAKGTVHEGKFLDSVEATLDLPVGASAQGIFGVRQVLTWETAAVRRVDFISMGLANPGEMSNSHRTSNKPLVAQKKATGTDAPKGDPRGGPGGKAGAGDQGLTPNGQIRDRYVEVTPQYRRLPVALVLIVNQDLSAKVQTAFADSQLRFLITQVLISRYPGSIRPPETATVAANPNPGGPVFGVRPGKGREPGGMPLPLGLGQGGPTAALAGGDEQESNLEMVIYGVVSLYERFPAKPSN